jgi:anti-sigma B factor antagonist
MDLRLRSRRSGGATVVEVGGEVELHSASHLRDELLRAGEAEHPCVVVDLSRVTFIDSTGLGVLVGALKRVREKGALSLVCPQRQVRRVFEITGLTRVFPMFNSLEEAVASCATKLPANHKASAAPHDAPDSEVAIGLQSSKRDEVQGGADE